MQLPIVDLHCDLLFYLDKSKQRTPYDLSSRCAFSQLQRGNVKIQTFAVFTHTEPDSVKIGLNQINLYQNLPKQYSHEIGFLDSKTTMQTSKISALYAFENASGFCGEDEKLKLGLNRLQEIIKANGKPLYVSLTWNGENRFGVGTKSDSQLGLKEDGKALLEELHQKGIAVDLSHASDRLAVEIIDFINQKNLDIPLIASHSNARSVKDVPRNLPDHIAKEIFRRGGPVGLNFYRPFIGESEHYFVKHIEHWLSLGGENSIAFGADFFYENDLPLAPGTIPYMEHYGDAACYNNLLHLLKKELGMSDVLLEKFANRNALRYIEGKFGNGHGYGHV